MAPYLSEQVKYAKEKRYPVLNLFTSNERAKLNILETIPDSILLKGEWPHVSCERKKKQTNKQKKNLEQSVAKPLLPLLRKNFWQKIYVNHIRKESNISFCKKIVVIREEVKPDDILYYSKIIAHKQWQV